MKVSRDGLKITELTADEALSLERSISAMVYNGVFEVTPLIKQWLDAADLSASTVTPQTKQALWCRIGLALTSFWKKRYEALSSDMVGESYYNESH